MPSLAKKIMLEELRDELRSQSRVFFSQNKGLNVSEIGELRRKLQKVSERVLVVKNTIAKRAFEELGVKKINGFLKGSVLLAYGKAEPQIVSKILVEFAKHKEHFDLAGAFLDGELCEKDYLASLAKLPSREVLIAAVMGGLNAPIGGFVNLLNQLSRSLVIALDQICKQKGT